MFSEKFQLEFLKIYPQLYRDENKSDMYAAFNVKRRSFLDAEGSDDVAELTDEDQ